MDHCHNFYPNVRQIFPGTLFSPDVPEAVVSNSFNILLCAIKNEWREDLEFYIFSEHWQIVRGYKLFLAALEFKVKIKVD